MEAEFSTPNGVDRPYHQHASRLVLMAEDWRAADVDLESTARNLDTYLYQYDL